MNDELNSAFEKFDRCMANFDSKGVDLSVIQSGSRTFPKQTEGADLIDLGSERSPIPLKDQFQAIGGV